MVLSVYLPPRLIRTVHRPRHLRPQQEVRSGPVATVARWAFWTSISAWRRIEGVPELRLSLTMRFSSTADLMARRSASAPTGRRRANHMS